MQGEASTGNPENPTQRLKKTAPEGAASLTGRISDRWPDTGIMPLGGYEYLYRTDRGGSIHRKM